jgi:DNA-directed RNA polymerase subunit omega
MTEELIEETEAQPAREQDHIDSKYRMIILAAQRSKQLQQGATVRVEMDSRKHKPTRIALRELEQGKVPFDTLAD